MKIIDLLVKIANGEETPNKIKWQGRIYEKRNETTYMNEYNELFESNFIFEDLTDEIEIIEDKPKIEKIKMNGNGFYSEYVESWIEKSKCDAYCEYLSNKINELIEQVNYLLEKSDSND